MDIKQTKIVVKDDQIKKKKSLMIFENKSGTGVFQPGQGGCIL
jgi:hypothetical protein